MTNTETFYINNNDILYVVYAKFNVYIYNNIMTVLKIITPTLFHKI